VRAVIGFFEHRFELRDVTPAPLAATTSPPFDRLFTSQDALAPLNLRELLNRTGRTNIGERRPRRYLHMAPEHTQPTTCRA
jgi:hypothetical protein